MVKVTGGRTRMSHQNQDIRSMFRLRQQMHLGMDIFSLSNSQEKDNFG